MIQDLLQPETESKEHGSSSDENREDTCTSAENRDDGSPQSDHGKGSSAKMSTGRPSPTSSAKSRSSIPDPVVYEPPERRRSAISKQEDPIQAAPDQTEENLEKCDQQDEVRTSDDSVEVAAEDGNKTEQDNEAEDLEVPKSPEAGIGAASEDGVEMTSQTNESSPEIVSDECPPPQTEEEVPLTDAQDEKETADDEAHDHPAAQNMVSPEIPEAENPTGHDSDVPEQNEPNLPEGDSSESPHVEDGGLEEDDNKEPVTSTPQPPATPDSAVRNGSASQDDGTEGEVIIADDGKESDNKDDSRPASTKPDSEIAENISVEHKDELPSQEEEVATVSAEDVEPQQQETAETSSTEAGDEMTIEISIPAPPTVSEEDSSVKPTEEGEDSSVKPTEEEEDSSIKPTEEESTGNPTEEEDSSMKPNDDAEESSREPNEEESEEVASTTGDAKIEDSEDQPQENENATGEDAGVDDTKESAAIQPEEGTSGDGGTEEVQQPEPASAESSAIQTQDDDAEGAAPATTPAESSTTFESTAEGDESKSSSQDLSSPSKLLKRPLSPKRLQKTTTSPRKKNGQNLLSPTKTPDGRKLPPIKAPVGLAPNPNLKNIKSKIGSFDNIKYKPGGGDKKVITMKLEWKAAPKIGSLDKRKDKAVDELQPEETPESAKDDSLQKIELSPSA